MIVTATQREAPEFVCDPPGSRQGQSSNFLKLLEGPTPPPMAPIRQGGGCFCGAVGQPEIANARELGLFGRRTLTTAAHTLPGVDPGCCAACNWKATDIAWALGRPVSFLEADSAQRRQWHGSNKLFSQGGWNGGLFLSCLAR